MVVAPRQVDELGVGAAAKDLRIAIAKFLVQLAEGGNFRRADESEILGPEEIDLPLAGVVFVGDGFEGGIFIGADGCSDTEVRKFLANG